MCTIIIKLRPLDSSSLRTLNHASLQSDSGDLTVASQLIIADRFTMVTITVPLHYITITLPLHYHYCDNLGGGKGLFDLWVYVWASYISSYQ
jgi:hypothetical protein